MYYSIPLQDTRLKSAMLSLILALVLSTPPMLISAQAPQYDIEPPIEWKAIDWAPSTWFATPQTAQEESGDEWWYAHTNYYENGVHTGYITVGYATWVNEYNPVSNAWLTYQYAGFCTSTPASAPDPEYIDFEHEGVAKGLGRQTIARYDLDGTMIWCKRYNFGAFYNVIQLDNGDIVAVGTTTDIVPAITEKDVNGTILPDPLTDIYVTGANTDILYNPTVSSSSNGNTFPTSLCNGTKHGNVIRVTPAGDVVFNYIYGYPKYGFSSSQVASAYYGGKSQLWSVIQDGSFLRLGGSSNYDLDGESQIGQPGNDIRNAAFLMTLDLNGKVQRRSIFLTDEAHTNGPIVFSYDLLPNQADLLDEDWEDDYNANPNSKYSALFNALKVEDSELYAAGYFFGIIGSTNEYSDSRYTVARFDLASNHEPIFVWERASNDGDFSNDDFGNRIAESGNNISDIELSDTEVIVPVIRVTDGWIFAGTTIADGQVIGLSRSNGQVSTNALDLGELRAYDMKIGITECQNGDWAIVSAKRKASYNNLTYEEWFDSPTGDGSTDVMDCLLELNPSQSYWEGKEGMFDYWSTDAYVARIESDLSSIIWDKQWDSSDNAPRECWPGNLKQQECLYTITEADDGGIVVAGNTGDNFDDGYLCKIKEDCIVYDDFSVFRGLESQILPWFTVDPNNEHRWIATSNANGQTISTDMNIHKTIVIPDNVHLSIDATLSFIPEGQVDHQVFVQVEPGGRLDILDDGIVTAMNTCYGIEVWEGMGAGGAQGLPQSTNSSGRIVMHPGSTISNANIALSNHLHNADKSVDWPRVGGWIDCTSATILNNVRDAEFLIFKNYNGGGIHVGDQSRFITCNFLTDDNHILDSGFNDHVTLWAVSQVSFKGSHFEDQRTGIQYPWERRDGIFSIDASYQITNNTVFKNLGQAIESYGEDNSLLPITVNDNTFDNCWRGIYTIGTTNMDILNNTMAVPTYVGVYPTSGPYGIYIDKKSKFFDVEGNTLTSTYQNYTFPFPISAGILVKSNSGTEEVYHNTISGFVRGIQAIGKNRNSIGDGLQLLCNELDNDRRDIDVVGLPGQTVFGIAEDQGQSGGLPSDPANNTFTNLNFNGLQRQYVNDGEHIDYYFNTLLPDGEPTAIGGDILPVPLTIFETDGCPTIAGLQGGNGGSRLAARNQASDDQLAVEQALIELIDDGNSPLMETEVILTDAQNAWEKYLMLMAVNGYLSEDVLAEIAKNENGFSPAMTRDILTNNAHAAKSEAVNQELDQRSDPLPDYMRSQIDAGKYSLSAKEILESYSRMYKVLHDRAIQDIIDIAGSRDSLDIPNLNLAIAGLSGTNDPAMDYALAELYDANGEQALADGLLEVMNTLYTPNQIPEHEEYIAYRSTVTSWINSGQKMNRLENEQISYLQEYIETDNQGSEQAIAMLALNDALDYEEPINYDDDLGKSLSRDGKPSLAIHPTAQLSAFPNPTSDFVTIEYEIYEEFQRAELRFVDYIGRIAYRHQLKTNHDQVLIDLPKDLNGHYECVLSVDGITFSSTPINIAQR